MPAIPASDRDWGPAVETFLLGPIDFDACLALQQRLVYEIGGRDDGQIALLVCEHSPCITVGRIGSRSHIRLSPAELTSRQLAVRWVNRGGGCLVHSHGQLAIYPIVPLKWHGFTVGDYLGRLQAGLLATLSELGVAGQTRVGQYGVWGRSGQLVAIGAAVKNWITYHGAFLNVSPAMHIVRSIQSDPETGDFMSSLVVERQQPVKMAHARAILVRHLAEAFSCQRYHLYTGHPLLSQLSKAPHESAARVV